MPSPPSNPHSPEFEAYAKSLLQWEEADTDQGRVILIPRPVSLESARERPPFSARLHAFAGDAVYIAFSLAGWLAINILGSLGCAVAFFIVISAGDWDAFFLQLDNLTSRYVAADLGRRGAFEHQIAIAFLLMLGLISLLRLPGFLRNLRGGLIQGRVR